MTPDQAYQTLCSHFNGHDLPDPLSAAWRALDAALRADGTLPQAWERLGAPAAGKRVGRSPHAWGDLVAKGYAPPADGRDAANRPFWHPATVDAYRNGEWKPAPRVRPANVPPPITGRGGGRDDWAAWASAHGVTVLKRMTRATIQEECRKAGLI